VPHSKLLVHWTGQTSFESLPDADKTDKYADRLKDWYQKGLFTKKKDELLLRLPRPGQGYVKKPHMDLVRLCFTEIRLSQAKSHSKRYGKLGIGFNRDYIVNKGGRPVIYVPWEAQFRLLDECIWQAWEKAKSQGSDGIEKLLKWILAFCKLMSNGEPEDSPKYEDYYEEMEWRLVYGESLDTSGTFVPDAAEPDAYRMKFEPSDVVVIVFPNNEVMRKTLNDINMKAFFAVHQPNLLLLEDCGHF